MADRLLSTKDVRRVVEDGFNLVYQIVQHKETPMYMVPNTSAHL